MNPVDDPPPSYAQCVQESCDHPLQDYCSPSLQESQKSKLPDKKQTENGVYHFIVKTDSLIGISLLYNIPVHFNLHQGQ
jgi:hypothetical protein